MNALSRTFTDLTTTLAKATRPVSINIGPSVQDFFGNDGYRMGKLQSAADKLIGAAIAPGQYAHMLNADDFAILKAFVAYLDSEFAIAGPCRRDDAADQQQSRDGYGVIDRHQI